VTQCHAQGAYPLAYYPHNYHFLAACATLEGNSEWALKAAEKMSDHTNHKGMLLEPLVTLQHFYSIPYFVQVKFAKWNDILKEGPPDSVLLYPNGIYHYAKGMAHIGMGQLDKAQLELDALSLVEKEDTLKKLTIWGFNSLHEVIAIAQKVLAGELAGAKGDYDEAARLLKEAIVIEDQLQYQEPPDWFFSVRHHLGAILLDAKKPREAIEVFNEDLQTYPKNGWALSGLKKAYEDLNEKDQAAAIDAQLKEAWATADVKISASRVQ
jgi:tetratricopeptide (TPR) repeat protein